MPSSAKMRVLEKVEGAQGSGRYEKAVDAAFEVLEKALREKQAAADGSKDPVEALVVIAMALEL